MVQGEVSESVWRWRWRRLEAKTPSLQQGDGRHGCHIRPIFRLLDSKSDAKHWGPRQRGGLRSIVMNCQWPQARLHKAGMADSFNCQLCVQTGLCDPP